MLAERRDPITGSPSAPPDCLIRRSGSCTEIPIREDDDTGERADRGQTGEGSETGDALKTSTG